MQGLQVFDKDGNLSVDSSRKVAKIIGRYTTHTASGSLKVTGGTPWAFFLQSPTSYDVIRKHGDKYHSPTVRVVGDSITWDDCVGDESVFIYGIY